MKIPNHAPSTGIDVTQCGFFGYWLAQYLPERFSIAYINQLKHGAHIFSDAFFHSGDLARSLAKPASMLLHLMDQERHKTQSAQWAR